MADIGGSSRVNTSKVDEEIVVGFDNEIMMIKEQLTRGKKQQEVVSIIGMAGLGKTTLARKVYDDPLIVYHFHIRAWAYVSQVYRKRDLLLGILSYVTEHTDEMHEMSDEELSLKLKKGLMGWRYLIVMDDIWSVDAWDCLKRSFPDDNNGSRIMFTSRLKDVALHAQPDSHPHCLRFLTEDESWCLFQRKVFVKETCPQVLMGIGKHITKKCLGLPLAIVETAGLLAKIERSSVSWEEVAKNVSSSILVDPKQFMDTLADNESSESWEEFAKNMISPLLAEPNHFMGSSGLWEEVAKDTSSTILADPKQFMYTLADIGVSSRVNTSKVDEEIVVGFDNEIMMIKDQLTGGKKQEVVSIIGMAGLGKTTLARKVYDDPLIEYHFHIRAWAYVSQVYRKRDLLLGILSYVIELTDEMHEMSDEELSLKLKKGLMGRRYLIVMDDIWSVDAWDCLKRSFPNDNNGSRIMFTSRLKDVALHAQPDSHLHCLRFLTEDESWCLFHQKVFGKETCPQVLMGIGKKITKKCLGLPLAIVVTAGLLAKIERSSVSWEEVAKNLNSHILTDPKQFMDTLALSYNHLPNHLKTCFLYFGLFGGGHEVPVRNLIWLWVDGGFIKGIGKKCLEDVAADYLMDLISRSPVIVAKKGFSGEIRTCRMHDLLLDLSLIKAKEENFMQQFYRYPNPYANFERYRGIDSLPSSHIYLMPFAPHVHSLRCFVPEGNSNFLFCPTLQLVRMLDLSSICVGFFPSKILQLVHLRYLALWAHDGSLPASISNLRNLQTFVVSSGRNITVPQNFWKIVTLRHLYIKSGINAIEYPCLGDPAIGDDSPSLMADLQTISLVCPSRSCHDVLTKAPNLRELGFCGPLISESGDSIFPDLSNKNHLETLKLLNTRTVHGTTSTLYDLDKFPEKLKRLTLSGTILKWSEMWKLGLLPNLEVLKLKFHACVGPWWETCDGGFLQLKFLKFEDLDIVQWNASDSHFPSLERLVLHSCQKLVGIPSDLANISTLELIELNWCSPSSTESALEIQKQQESKGNDLLKVHIKPLQQENQESQSQHQGPFLEDYLFFGGFE